MTAPIWFAHDRDRRWRCDPPSPDALAFHRQLPTYSPTPLHSLPDLARELNVGRVFAKDESLRLDLPAFKALGASWAVDRALAGRDDATTVVTATDGNHGRAVARFAREQGRAAQVIVPPGLHPSAVHAIREEGATVTEVDGSYDDAVRAAADFADEHGGVLVQDTSWEGYQEIPRLIVEGYATLFAEIDDQLWQQGLPAPDLILVPTGVGSLLHAALVHYRSAETPDATAVISVEPETAACMAPSLAAGHSVTVPTAHTVLSGLNCGTPSGLAWPFIVGGLDAAVTVTDADAVQAARDLAELGIAAGPCGGAGLAASRGTLCGDGSGSRRRHLHLEDDATVVIIITEGTSANPLPDLAG